MLNIPIDLIRYLIILNVRGSLVWMPGNPAREISRVLGNAIAERLPTSRARLWKKSMAQWDEIREVSKTRVRVPENPWPVQSVLAPYRPKRSYGKGERIFLEFMLTGKDADHGIFMEEILPALEDLGTGPSFSRSASNPLWGSYEIVSVYSAKGNRWKPFIREGRLDLRVRVGPSQWQKGLKLNLIDAARRKTICWPGSFESEPATLPFGNNRPPLRFLLEAFCERLGFVLMGKYPTVEGLLDMLDEKDRRMLAEAFDAADKVGLKHNHMVPAPNSEPAGWMGSITLSGPVPEPILPLLETASILHLGRFTHFGCGNFNLSAGV